MLAPMRVAITLAALAACASASGCVTAAVAGGAAVVAMQDRTVGQTIDDASAVSELRLRLFGADRAAFHDVNVQVRDGNLLLSGSVPDEQHKQVAETLARSMPELQNVYNELFVGERTTFMRNAADELIIAQIRTRLTASPSVRAINLNIEAFHGNVYLIGTARSQHELQRAAEIASVVPGVHRVVSFMTVTQAPVPYYQQAQASGPPAPEYRAAQPQSAQTAQAETAGSPY